MGAVTLRETASASPAARANVLHTPKLDACSGNSMGIARLSPTSKTCRPTTMFVLHVQMWIITVPLLTLKWTVHASEIMHTSAFDEVLHHQWCGLATKSYQTVFPGGHQLSNVVHGVEDDVVQEFGPVHCHRTVLIHPGVHKHISHRKRCVLSWFVLPHCVMIQCILSSKPCCSGKRNTYKGLES